METVRVSASQSEEVSDDLLEALDDAVRAQDQDSWGMGVAAGAAAEPQETDPNREFELLTAAPQALNLAKLWEATGKQAPPDIVAALGPRTPILLVHRVTPFARPGDMPGGVWGMGYQVQLDRPTPANTVALMPSTEVTEVGAIDQEVDVGLSLGGDMEIPAQALDVVSELPGVNLHAAKVSVSADNRLSLAIHLKLQFLKVISGAVGAGGARWDMYHQDESLIREHSLLQTLLIPGGADTLAVTITRWIRRRGLFFGLLGSRQWSYPPQTYDVSLAGLGT